MARRRLSGRFSGRYPHNFRSAGVGGGGGGLSLPFSDDFARSDGAIGNGWTGATWSISGNKAINTPTLGSNVLTNGTFDTDTDWLKGTGWSIGSGVATHTDIANSNLEQTGVLTAGRWYRGAFDITAWTSGVVSTQYHGSPIADKSGVGSYYTTNRATSTSMRFRAPDFDGSIDNAVVQGIVLSSLFVTQDFGATDADISVAVTVAAGLQAGVVVSLDDPDNPANFVIGYMDHQVSGTTDFHLARLVKYVGGTATQLISDTVTYSAGDVLRVVKSGTTYQLYYDGTQVGTDQTISDANIISNTHHGMFSTDGGCSLDDFFIQA